MPNTDPVGRLTLNGTVIPLTTSTYIGVNGNYWVWDADLQKYVDSGYLASIRGHQGPQGMGIKHTAPVVDENGHLIFTLVDPAADGQESTITTNTSVQGVGIQSVVDIVDPSDTNYRKLQINLVDPKNGNVTSQWTHNTVIPLTSWDSDVLSIEVGGNTTESPHLQGVGINKVGSSRINDDGKLVLKLLDPKDGTETDLTSDKSVQGIGIGQISINENGQMVIPFIDPRTGAAPSSPTTVTTERIIPIFIWDDENHTLTINVGGQLYESESLQGDQGIQGIQGFQGIYVSSGEVSSIGELTFHLTDPSGQTTPADIEVEGRFTGPQGTLITGITVNNDYTITFELLDPSTGDVSSFTTEEQIQPTSVNGVEPDGNDVTLTGDDIKIDADSDMSIAEKIANMASVVVKDTAPDASGATPTPTEKLGLWVDRTTKLAYVHDADFDNWICLNAVWGVNS